MKIAHVVDSMEVGGAEILVSQMCHLQRAMGHEPCIYAVAALGALGQRMQAEGFSVQSNVGKNLQDATGNFLRIFRQSRPDAVHLHNPTPTIYAAMAARMAGVRGIVSTRHSLVASPHNRVMEFKYAIASRFCNWVIGICDATTNNIRSLHTVPAKKIVRIYNGTEPLPRIESGKWPNKSGFTLVYVGRLEAVKNHPLLFQAFRIALASRPDLQLWMVGDGSERAHLERLAREWNIDGHITFWGQQLDVAPFFSAADTFIMSSRSEGLPMSLLQAFSLGIPAIVTDVGGMVEVVRFAQAGYIVPAEDPPAMAQAILRMAERKQEWERFGRNAQAAYRSNFTLESMVTKYIGLYLDNPPTISTAKIAPTSAR